MLANGLIFLLGALVALLAALILAPLVWRKAQSLARRNFEATIPISPNEIRAEFDRVRAESALSVRRQEILSGEAAARLSAVRADLGRRTVENTELQRRNSRLSQNLEVKEGELNGVRAVLFNRNDDYERLEQQLSGVRHDADLTGQELEALAGRFRELGEIAEERKIQLIATETKLDRVSDMLRDSQRGNRDSKAVVERMQGEMTMLERALKQEKRGANDLNASVAALIARLADREEELSRLTIEPARQSVASAVRPALPASAVRLEAKTSVSADAMPRKPARSRSAWGSAETLAQAAVPHEVNRTPAAALPSTALAEPAVPAPKGSAEEADIRERISDIAARVIRMTALAEGSDSVLSRLIPPLSQAAGGRDGTDEQKSSMEGRPTLAERVRLLVEAERGHDVEAVISQNRPAGNETLGPR